MNIVIYAVCLAFAIRDSTANVLKDPYICGSPTCSPSEKFKYSPDVVYRYEYKVNINTWFSQTSNNQSTLDIRTIASVQFISPCEGLLQLNNVTLVDQDENYPIERAEKFIQALRNHDLRFAFHDGVISEICPDENEEDWVLNFKRGVVSMLQNTMKRFDINFKGVERDTQGTCLVDYTVRGQENTSLIIIKTRDLSQCTDRYKYLSILQTVRYNFQSKYQTWPVLKSESKCRISIDHNVYKSVKCKERHLFEPFSGKNSGGMTTVIQDFVLVEEKNKTDFDFVETQPKQWSVITTRSNLLHHHTAYVRSHSGELKSARDILKMLCKLQTSAEEGGSGSGGEGAGGKLDSSWVVGAWGALVRAARSLPHPALTNLVAHAHTICHHAQKHIMDALPYIASPGSVALIKEKIINGEVDQVTRDEWLMSMAMIPRPKADMLTSMLELLKSAKNDQTVSFTVSSMLHSYCKESTKSLRECCDESVPKQIVEVFQEIVIDIFKSGIATSPRESKNNIITAIKSLGNIGGFSSDFANVLMDIISDSTVPVNIRLTAIDAFRKTPCDETRAYFLEMFREDHVDIEVRLASYLQVMKCPTLSTIRNIIHALKNEPVNQAKTFVWSHMNNVAASPLPSRVEAQGLLAGALPHLEDKPDFRTFSRNYEKGVFFDQYNAGGNYEANVVFSPDSYIPRSVALNLTIDMFGESINLLEIKSRVEGFERYFESIFGGSGMFSKSKINDQIQRYLRSVNSADEARSKIDDLNYKNEALKHRFPLAELGIKVFGNEISFWSGEGDDEIREAFSKLNIKTKILEILSGKVISYNKASLFVDTTYSVPTGCGLPLTLNLMGTSYVNVNMSGNLEKDQNNVLLFKGGVKPSVSVNIAATMGVLAGQLTSTGVRINIRLYTSTSLDADLHLDGLKAMKLELSLPRNKQQIFAAKSDLIVLHGSTERLQGGLNNNRVQQNTCSWSTFDNAIGIKLCAAYQFPNMTNLRDAPYFILSGPAKYILSLEKADPSAKTYLFQYNWDENVTNTVVSFSFDTPNSKEKRMFNALVNLSQNSSNALIIFQSSKSTIRAEALYVNMENDKRLEAKVDVDGHKNFDMAMSLQKYPIKFGWVWIPQAYWVVNDEQIAGLTGSIKGKSKGGVTQWDINAEFQTKQLASELLGYYTLNGPTHGCKLQLDYQFYKSPKQSVKLEGMYSEMSQGYRRHVFGDLAMEFTAYPAYNFYSVLKNYRSQSHVDVGLNVSASRELKDEPNFSFAYVRVDKMTGVKLDTRLVLVKPKPVKIEFKYDEIGPKYNVYLLANFNPKSRDIVISSYLFWPNGLQLYLNGELNVTVPSLHPMTLNARLHEKNTNEYQLNANGVWFTSVDFNVDALYQDQSKTNLMSHRLKVLINSSHFKDISVDARFTQDNRQIAFIGRGEYNSDTYSALLRHQLLSEHNFTSYVEVDVNGRAYSVDLSAALDNDTDVDIHLHMHKVRDVHMSYHRWDTERQKRLSAAINWDANRDPTQKLSVDLQLDNKGPWHRAASMSLYYPGRAVTGDLEFLLKDWHVSWHAKLNWAPGEEALWTVTMYSLADKQTVYALMSNLDTPLSGWEKSSFNLMWRYHNNLQAVNGSVTWQKDYLAFSLLADYLFRTNEFYGEINAVVNSTIPTLPRAAAIAKHRVVWKKSADTLLSFQYNEEGKLMINSSWSLDRGSRENNVTGKVIIISPFQGYKNGYLSTKFIFGHKRDISGITDLTLEDKILKIYVNGYMRRLSNSMLTVTAHSAGSDAPTLTARLGFVEAERHLVALLVTQTSTTGVEVKLSLVSLQDFHVYGLVALPIQYLNRAMVTAKRSKEEVDFRLGWSDLDAGFTGVWRYQSPLNFVYIYKLYTPLEGFEENGLVLKNVYDEHGLDSEVSVRLSTHKFGIAVLLQNNGKGLLDVIKEKFQHSANNHDQFIDNFDTSAKVVLDTLYYPTITYQSHLMKFVGPNEEDILEVNATLHLPNKTAIVLTDIFVLETQTVMHNRLNLVTPFKVIKELKSLFTVDIVLGEKFNITCMALLYNSTYWHEISSKLYYEFEAGEDNAYQSYVSSLGIITPLAVLPSLECLVTARLEDSLWRMSADIEMPSCKIEARGNLELDDPFVETSGSLNLTSVYLEDYFIKMDFKKDFSETENMVAGGIQIQQGDENNYAYAEAVWRDPPNRNIKFKSKAALYPVLPPAEVILTYSQDLTEGVRSATVDVTVGDDSYYSVKADQRPTSVSVSVKSPHEGFKAIKVLGAIENDDSIRGSFVTDSMEYAVSGKVLNKEPLELSLNLVPRGKGEPILIRVKLESSEQSYAISAHIDPLSVTVHARADFQDNYTDVNFKVDIPRSRDREIFVKARVEHHPELRRTLAVTAAAPLARIRHLKADADFQFGPKTGYLVGKYDLPDMRGDGQLHWSFLLGDLYIRALGHQHITRAESRVRSVHLDIFFGNNTSEVGMNTNNAGFKMDLDRIWQIGANTSFGHIPESGRISLNINAILPRPNVDVHSITVESEMSEMTQVLAEYRTDVTGVLAKVDGEILNIPETFKGNASVHWGSNHTVSTVDNRLQYLYDDKGNHYLNYALTSPLYENETTFLIDGFLNERHLLEENYKVVKFQMYAPGRSRTGDMELRYGGLKHTDGHFNFTTPFARLPWLKSIFNITNTDEHSDNKVRIYWKNKTAEINTTHLYVGQNGGFKQTGEIALSVPLSKQHLVATKYYYVQEAKGSNGNATVDLDGDQSVKASFNQRLDKSERGLDRATTDIEVENDHTPIGVHYIHEYTDTGTIDVRQATVFHLHNATKFNVTGKIDILNHETGKDMKLTAIHGHRTLTFENEYQAKDRELKQGSKIKWAPDTWVNYDIHVTNMTTDEKESQQLIMNMWWPLRTFNLVALYNLHDTLLDGNARLNWNVKDENKTAELRGRWENPPNVDKNKHIVDLALAHPSFSKDVTLKGLYVTTPSIMSDVTVELQYSDYESEYLKLQSILIDNSNGPIRDYKFALNCTHPATNLDLEIRSDVNIHSRWYYVENYYRFQKSLFSEKLRHLRVLADMNNSLIHYERKNETNFYNATGGWDFTYPNYQIFSHALRDTGNDTGRAILSIHDKTLTAHYNATDDISYHLIGMIVDTRSAKLNAWRDFDDVTTVDLASYIRLNHSRLLTSSFVWRPEIFGEIKSSVVQSLKNVYNQFNDTLVIVKEIPMDGHKALKNIWTDAKPRIKEFLDDLNDLHVIKDDLDEFESYLNASYESNDFYVKDVVEFTYFVLDEMAIRNHLESLPEIVNDMWGMMGNTSQSIKQSLTFVIDTVKKAYANFLESTNKFLEADFMELVSDRLEAIILQYDNFVRNLHLKLLEYWEATWVNATSRLAAYWHDILKSIEPLFFKVLHYTESFVFNLARGVMDFFYNRTQEITGSPYFNYVQHFGHEMDAIYKDIKNNDIYTNIKKYSQKMWNLVWSKIEEYIPFKDEVSQLYQEFKNAWSNFLQTPQVLYVREKYKEAYYRLAWWYEYFQIGEALQTTWDLIADKITDMARTALQYEEIHRTPKTNFIFDPRKGEILLEQKLPMSWHAFNRTPDFSEIPEYKALRSFMDEWLTTNKTLWSYYYEIRPYMDFNNVLPPFGGMAIMTGQGTLITFDKRVFTINEPGTFLLTKDYRTNNFTILMESNDQGHFNLVILTRSKLVYIDLYKELVSLDKTGPIILPRIVDGCLIERKTDEVIVSTPAGLTVSCHLLFHTCKIEIAGWYYASLGGLLGTFNNEQYDDLQLPNNTITTSIPELGRSWNLDPQAEGQLVSKEFKNDTVHCEKIFRNKVSPLHACFSAIDASPFFEQCVQYGSVCALSAAYLELCRQQHVPIRAPEQCLQCITPDGDTLDEGAFYDLKNPPQTADIVFVVEASQCNKNLRKKRNMDLFIEAFDSKLQDSGLDDNRYAVVAFGGSRTYNRPRALYLDSRVFLDSVDIPRHFDNLAFDKEELSRQSRRPDMFAALSFATTLPFRPGAPRLVILLPCGKCDSVSMRLDYSTIYHNLIENSITLHILMEDDFVLNKRRVNKYLFGVDATKAYTNKDYERLTGDEALRKQVRLPKEKLGLCTSLALETNGTIFDIKKLSGERGLARRVSSVLAGRAAPAPRPARCECRRAALACRRAQPPDRLPQIEMSFWNSDDIEDLIDMAMEPNLPLS